MWTSQEQLAFLEARETLHSDAKRDNTLSPFWDSLKAEWIQKFGMDLFLKQSTPGSPMGMRRLRQWFNNRRNTTNSTASRSGGRTTISIAPRKQRYQPSQAYSKLYYASKIAPVMETEYAMYQQRLKDLAKGLPVEFPPYQEVLRLSSKDLDTGL
ncbi:hypothetical protein BD410DRAFT_845706 [Rickenella mellea]|uniref:Uncharacterized protein n=1 Tax=Rickenella mellea TaxID=50990 RepID=A0A4Y7PJV3_9AGAM|nr:hypothetical protein BD410DRAFT_845706 [Rickenella mellea]